MKKRETVLKMQRNYQNCVQKHNRKTFDNLVTGSETLVYYFKPQHKSSNRIWTLKNAKRPSINRLQTVKKVLYFIFLTIKAMLCKLLCQWATFTDNFFKNICIVIQKLSKYNESLHPNIIRSISDFCTKMLLYTKHASRSFWRRKRLLYYQSPPPLPLGTPVFSDLVRCDFCLFLTLKFHLHGFEKKDTNHEKPLCLQFISKWWVKRLLRSLKNIYSRLIP